MIDQLRYIDSVELLKKKVDLKDYQYPLGIQDAFGPGNFGRLAIALIGRGIQEKFIIVMYGLDDSIVGYSEINKGHEAHVNIDIHSTLRTSVIAGARRIALSHNHPTGDPTPSGPDVATTLKIIKAAAALDIEVMDHVVVSDTSHVSIRERVGETTWALALRFL